VTAAPRRAVVAASAAAVALGTVSVLRQRPPGGRDRWVRRNFRDRQVDLFGGPGAAAGAVAAAVSAGSASGAVVTATAASLGLYDDLFGNRHARGLHGHLRELRAGRLTTGAVKLAGLVSAGVTGAALDRRRGVDVLIDAALVAGSANLVNLLDLRPGRALKVVAAVGTPFLACRDVRASVAAGLLATAAVSAPTDLAEQRMLGDCGANALGALAGWLVARTGRTLRVLVLAAVVGLTLVSERVSFSSVIDRTPVLARIDAWGRRAA
jgi:UDP-N-acetylmuramyl pentapeptide phosphotransferase/UDP-N-acetylglucosamine-1-phosphate transferase